jgi:glycosyltransferase involved in cell wall biosynthesis
MNEISVIVPTYNSSSTIEKTLQSIINQTKSVYEIVVSDNQSSDNTALIVKDFIDKNSNHTFLFTTCDLQGAGPNRNHAVSLAKGPILAFLDSDDVWDSNFLEVMTKDLLPSNMIRGAYARYTTKAGYIFGSSIRSSNDVKARYLMLQKGVMPFLLSSWVMQKSCFLNLGGFDSEYLVSQDFELMHRHLDLGGEIQVIREELLTYNIQPTSETTTTHFQQRLTSLYVLRRKHLVDLSVHQFIERGLRNPFLYLQSKSDILIRTFFLRQTSNKLIHFEILILAFLLSPIRFLKKTITQRPKKSLGILKSVDRKVNND